MSSYKNSDPHPPIMQGSPPPKEMRVPLIDWDRGPWNRWSFQHVREIVPTTAIPCGNNVFDLPKASGDLSNFSYTAPNGQKTTLSQMLDDTYTDGLFIWKNNQILHESYHNGMTPKTVHLLQSVSKSITSAAAGCLISDGLLTPEALVTDYLPELEKTGWKGARLQHIFDMTSGTQFTENYTVPDSDMGIMDYACGWKPAPEGVDASHWPTSIWDQILGLKVVTAEHGEKFEYRSIETDVLAHAMERVTGQRLADILSERLWKPLGCEHDANITVDSAGYGLACGGISASLRDMARFGLMLLGNGVLNGRQIVPIKWCQDILHGAHGLYDVDNYKNWPSGSYRNKFWIEDSRLGRHYCFGVFGQMVMVAPDTGMMAVKLSTWPDFVNNNLYKETLAGLLAVEKAF